MAPGRCRKHSDDDSKFLVSIRAFDERPKAFKFANASGMKPDSAFSVPHIGNSRDHFSEFLGFGPSVAADESTPEKSENDAKERPIKGHSE
jgi:hypothetical protein